MVGRYVPNLGFSDALYTSKFIQFATSASYSGLFLVPIFYTNVQYISAKAIRNKLNISGPISVPRHSGPGRSRVTRAGDDGVGRIPPAELVTYILGFIGSLHDPTTLTNEKALQRKLLYIHT